MWKGKGLYLWPYMNFPSLLSKTSCLLPKTHGNNISDSSKTFKNTITRRSHGILTFNFIIQNILKASQISARSLLLLTPKDTSEEICHCKHLHAGVNSLSVAFPSKVGVLHKLKNAADRWMVVLHLHIMKKR